MKRKQTSPDLRKIVIKLKNEGKSLKEIGEILNLSKSTVQVIVKNFETTGSYENKLRSGRPPKLNERIQRRILREINEHPMENAVCIVKGIEKDYEIAAHAEIVRRSPKNGGLNCRVARRKPLWRDVNISKRLNYAQKYQNTHQTDPTYLAKSNYH